MLRGPILPGRWEALQPKPKGHRLRSRRSAGLGAVKKGADCASEALAVLLERVRQTGGCSGWEKTWSWAPIPWVERGPLNGGWTMPGSDRKEAFPPSSPTRRPWFGSKEDWLGIACTSKGPSVKDFMSWAFFHQNKGKPCFAHNVCLTSCSAAVAITPALRWSGHICTLPDARVGIGSHRPALGGRAGAPASGRRDALRKGRRRPASELPGHRWGSERSPSLPRYTGRDGFFKVWERLPRFRWSHCGVSATPNTHARRDQDNVNALLFRHLLAISAHCTFERS